MKFISNLDVGLDALIIFHNRTLVVQEHNASRAKHPKEQWMPWKERYKPIHCRRSLCGACLTLQWQCNGNSMTLAPPIWGLLKFLVTTVWYKVFFDEIHRWISKNISTRRGYFSIQTLRRNPQETIEAIERWVVVQYRRGWGHMERVLNCPLLTELEAWDVSFEV